MGNLFSKIFLKEIFLLSFLKWPKTGFCIPIEDWLRGPLVEWANELLSPDLLKAQGYLNPDIVQKIWTDHKNRNVIIHRGSGL